MKLPNFHQIFIFLGNTWIIFEYHCLLELPFSLNNNRCTTNYHFIIYCTICQ